MMELIDYQRRKTKCEFNVDRAIRSPDEGFYTSYERIINYHDSCIHRGSDIISPTIRLVKHTLFYYEIIHQ